MSVYTKNTLRVIDLIIKKNEEREILKEIIAELIKENNELSLRIISNIKEVEEFIISSFLRLYTKEEIKEDTLIYIKTVLNDNKNLKIVRGA